MVVPVRGERNWKGRSGVAARRATVMISLLIGALLLGSLPGTVAEPMTHAEAIGEIYTASETGNWTITFRANQQVPERGMVRVVFPAAFTASEAFTSCERHEGNTTVIMETFVVNDREVVCRLGASESIPAATIFSVNLTEITNPEEPGETGNFLIQTRDASGNGLDHDATTTVVIEPRSPWLGSLAVRAAAQTTGTQEEWTATFRPEQNMSAVAAVRVLFVEGFQPLDDPAEACVQDSSGSVVRLERTVNGTLITCSLSPSSAPAANQTASFRLGLVRNPTVADGQVIVQVDVIDEDGQTLEAAAVPVSITPHAFTVGPDHHSSVRIVGAVTEHHFNMTTFNRWSADGSLAIRFPAGFTLMEPGPQGLRVTTPTNATVAFGPPEVHGTSMFMQRQAPVNATGNNNTTTPGGAVITLTIHGIQNPQSPMGPAFIVVETMDGLNRVHDRGAAQTPAIVDETGLEGGGVQPDPPSADLSNQTSPDGQDGTNPNPAGPFEDSERADVGGSASGLGAWAALAGLAAAFAARTRRP